MCGFSSRDRSIGLTWGSGSSVEVLRHPPACMGLVILISPRQGFHIGCPSDEVIYNDHPPYLVAWRAQTWSPTLGIDRPARGRALADPMGGILRGPVPLISPTRIGSRCIIRKVVLRILYVFWNVHSPPVSWCDLRRFKTGLGWTAVRNSSSERLKRGKVRMAFAFVRRRSG